MPYPFGYVYLYHLESLPTGYTWETLHAICLENLKMVSFTFHSHNPAFFLLMGQLLSFKNE